jgi:hypothetical protein
MLNKSLDGRARTATLLSRYQFNSNGLFPGFAPPHLKRCALSYENGETKWK